MDNKYPTGPIKSLIEQILNLQKFKKHNNDRFETLADREMDEFKLKHFKRFQSLTEREVEILYLLANGYNNPKIADKLLLSRSTVETHRKNLKRKLELKSLRDLMRYTGTLLYKI